MLFEEEKREKNSRSDLKRAFSDKIIEAMEFKRFECIFMRARVCMCVCILEHVIRQTIN